MKKFLILLLAITSATCFLTAVGCGNHNFSSTYSYDEDMHWKACLDEGCDEVSSRQEHEYQLVGTVSTCKVCGYNYNTSNTYEITLTTMGETYIPGTNISLYDASDNLIATAKTNIRGKARFANINPANYKAVIDESSLPNGYYVDEDNKEISLSAQTMKLSVKLPSRLIDEEIPANHKYSVGDVMHNLQTTSVNKNGTQKNISLSAYLSQYKAVVLNFWYASCGPCMEEFPYMNEAYLDNSDKIAIIAINSGAETPSEVADFVATTGYNFDFVNDSQVFSVYNSAFSVQAYPTTVVVDRYGAVAQIESGSIPSRSYWVNLINHYTALDYTPNYSSNNNDFDSNGNENELVKPNVEMPSSEEIAQKITSVNSYTTKNAFTYLPADDEYSWPWILDEKDGVSCLKTSNADRGNSYSILLIDVELRKGQQLFFDYLVSTEEDSDILYVQVDTVLQHTLSGENSGWNNDKLLYVAQRDGKYQISLTYQKNLTNRAGDDTVYIKNLRIEEGKQITDHVDLLYNATENYTLDPSVTVPGEYKGFINHVPYYFNEEDGFYHVMLSSSPSEIDPILMADLYYSTPWNPNSVWLFAYAGTGLFDKTDENYVEGYYEAIEDYSWLQQNSEGRYVPLTKELHDILIDVVADLGRTDNSEDPHNGQDQWLEICRYYVHYGERAQSDVCVALDNTVEALKWRVAKDYGVMTEDTFKIHVNVYSVHLPRGNYYRFKTTKAGAYLVRSIAPLASDYDPNGIDALGFVCDAYGNILAENDNHIIEVQGYGKDENGVVQEGNNRYALYDNNFYMYVYLEANTTYYVAGCFNDPYAMGEYDVMIEYLGKDYSYFTSCATDPAYTYDENDPNFTPIIVPQMGKDRFFLGDDGNYYAQEYDGSQGSLLYIRLVGPTYYSSYTSTTLEQMIESGAIGASESDKLYLKHLLIESRTKYDKGHELYGYTVATEKLVSIINKAANGNDTEEDSTYSHTSWLLTAYYYRNVTPLTLQQASDKYN